MKTELGADKLRLVPGSYCIGGDAVPAPCTCDGGYFCPPGSHSPAGQRQLFVP